MPLQFKSGFISEENIQFVYSHKNFHPFSFFRGSKKYGGKDGKLYFPSPQFIDSNLLIQKQDMTRTEILRGMIINDTQGLVLIDAKIMEKFKGLISNMIKQMIQHVFGRPISLPVRLFEPKSTLHRICEYWSFAPQFLNKAAEIKDNPLLRMKYIITFAASGLYVSTKQLKPFNPLIGETFQAEFECGTKIYVEHISHYPTICRFLIQDKAYKLYGYFDFITKTESFGSRISVVQKGPITIEFDNNNKIIYNMPVIKLLNASQEENRSSIWVDSMIFVDVKNNLKGVVKFGHNKHYIHGFDGFILEHLYDKNYKYDFHKEEKMAHDMKVDGKHIKEKILSKVTGSWLKDIKFDNEQFWNLETFTPAWIKPIQNVLPSDWRFREDLIWLFRSFNAINDHDRKLYEEYSQGWKIHTETIQRAEREIRKKFKTSK